jgi:hypothetical protein
VCVEAIPLLESGYRVIGVEELGLGGAAPKGLVVFPSQLRFGHAYVAKQPIRTSSGPRECVTEYLLSAIGKMLPLRVAEGRLARLATPHRHPPDVRFLSRFFIRPNEELRHGVELVAICFEVTEKSIQQELQKGKEERSFYTVDLVDDVFGTIAGGAESHARLRGGLARMLAYDALVGAQDRHARNWGVVADPVGGAPLRFAPVFDTARGLLVTLSDDDLRAKIAAGRTKWIEEYAARSTCLIGTGNPEEKTHFDLVRFMAGKRRELYGCHVTAVVEGFRLDRVRRMLHSRFGRLFSRLRLELIAELLEHRHGVLKKLCARPKGR